MRPQCLFPEGLAGSALKTVALSLAPFFADIGVIVILDVQVLVPTGIMEFDELHPGMVE